MKTPSLLLLLLSLFLLPDAFCASTEKAEQQLHSAVSDVLKAAEKSPNNQALARNLTPILTRYISFEAMTRRAVGPGWRQFSSDQKKKATQLFTTLIIRTYSDKLTPGEQPEVKFKKASAPAPGRVEIPTHLLYQGSRYDVTYRLEEAEGWQITDVVIEGVSLVANYRTQFDAAFKRNGADAVISALTQAQEKL